VQQVDGSNRPIFLSLNRKHTAHSFGSLQSILVRTSRKLIENREVADWNSQLVDQRLAQLRLGARKSGSLEACDVSRGFKSVTHRETRKEDAAASCEKGERVS
jgi:hypothetical protein